MAKLHCWPDGQQILTVDMRQTGGMSLKTHPFDLHSLKAKRRYEINKGLKNFQFRRINHKECAEEIYNVTVAAYSAYPQKYRPSVQKEIFSEILKVIKGSFMQSSIWKRMK